MHIYMFKQLASTNMKQWNQSTNRKSIFRKCTNPQSWNLQETLKGKMLRGSHKSRESKQTQDWKE